MANRPRNTGFGSSYSPVNNLAVPEAAMRVNRVRFFHPIIKQGNWVVKKLDFDVEDKVTIRTRVTGAGFGYLYATFDDPSGTQILAIKKVTAGFHDISFTVPYPTLSNFRIGVSSTIPMGYSIDLLDNETRYKIRTNSLMTQQHQPMYESPGIGFAGFGALADQNINDPAKGGKDSGGNPYWDGDFQNFSWQNGYSGDRAVHTSSANVPEAIGSYHGYYAHRVSLMQAVFDENDQFLGWDALEGKSGDSLKVPTGVPICMVLQFFTLNRKGEDKGNKDPRKAGNPYWIYANDYQISPSNFSFVHESYSMNGLDRTRPKDMTPRPETKKGVIKTVNRNIVYSPEQGDTWNDVSCMMEWYNPSSGNWSMSRTPTYIPKTDSRGFTKVIFRAPRQLSPETDKDIIAQLTAAGINYDYNITKQAYPMLLKGYIKDPPAEKAYALLGRPNETDTVYQEGNDWYFAPKVYTRLSAFMEYGIHPKAGYTNNQRDGNESRGTPKAGRVRIVGGKVELSDAEKMARMNYPELMYAFYPLDGFKTGGRIYAIGRGLSTSTTAAMSTTQNLDPLQVYPNRQSNPDGSGIGTKEASRIKPKQLILSTDLGDDRAAIGEEALQAAWKQKFGKQLDLNFFKDFGLRDSVKERPHMYRMRDPASGLYIEAPYQIMIFEIGPEYDGPAVFYELQKELREVPNGQEEVSKLKVSKPEGKPYARSKAQPIYLNVRTPFGYKRSQKLDIVDEVEQQVTLLEAGLTPEEVLAVNELDNAPTDSTVVLNEQAVQDQYLTDMEVLEKRKEKATGTGTRGRRLVRARDAFNPFPKYYREINGFGAFTNSRDFYVEDVTSKWNANSVSGLGSAYGSNLAGPLDIFDPLQDVVKDNAEAIRDYSAKTMKTAVAVGGVILFGPAAVRALGKAVSASVRSAKDVGAAFRYKPRGTAARRRAQRRR